MTLTVGDMKSRVFIGVGSKRQTLIADTVGPVDCITNLQTDRRFVTDFQLLIRLIQCKTSLIVALDWYCRCLRRQRRGRICLRQSLLKPSKREKETESHGTQESKKVEKMLYAAPKSSLCRVDAKISHRHRVISDSFDYLVEVEYRSDISGFASHSFKSISRSRLSFLPRRASCCCACCTCCTC